MPWHNVGPIGNKPIIQLTDQLRPSTFISRSVKGIWVFGFSKRLICQATSDGPIHHRSRLAMGRQLWSNLSLWTWATQASITWLAWGQQSNAIGSVQHAHSGPASAPTPPSSPTSLRHWWASLPAVDVISYFFIYTFALLARFNSLSVSVWFQFQLPFFLALSTSLSLFVFALNFIFLAFCYCLPVSSIKVKATDTRRGTCSPAETWQSVNVLAPSRV